MAIASIGPLKPKWKIDEAKSAVENHQPHVIDNEQLRAGDHSDRLMFGATESRSSR
jgi:hypothetical protein